MDQTSDALLVRRYDADGVWIGERRCTAPLLLTRQRLIDDWPAASLASLEPAHLDAIFASKAAIVIIGTRATERIAPAAIRQAFRARNLPLESMELGAACRTYNVLVAEGREALLALFP